MASRRRQRLSTPRLLVCPALLLLLLPLLLFSVASGAVAARTLPPTAPDADGGYVVVVDAGSTGSRAHIYRFVLPPEPSSSPSSSSPSGPPPPPRPLLPEVSPAAPSLKREPGLSATRPEDVAEALRPLLEYAAAHVPREHHATTDVLVLATAGLRALPRPEDREARLRAASDAVAAFSPFPRPRRGAVATLRGIDEGALAWVAANAAAGTLVHRGGGKGGGGGGEGGVGGVGARDSAPAPLSASSSSSPSGVSGTGSGTIGIAEIGGTSMQVTFEVPESTESESKGGGSGSEEAGDGPPSSPSTADIFLLELPSSAASASSPSGGGFALFRLFSRSWEGLGLEAARATTAAVSSSSSAASASSSASSGSQAEASASLPSSRELDPCVPPGAVVPLPPGVVLVADDAAALSGASSSSGVGTGDFDACRSAASQALRLSCAARPDHCPLPSDASARERPPPNLSGMELLGIENLRHTASALGLLARGRGGGGGGGGAGGGGGGGRPTLREIVAAGRALCGGGGGKRQVEEKRSGGGEEGQRGRPPPPALGAVEAARHCFGAAYTVALLQDAFGIGLDERGVEFSGSVVAAADAATSASASSVSSAAAPIAAVQAEKEPGRVTPEWTSAAAALAAADVAASRATSARKKTAAATKKAGPGSSSASPLPFEALLRAPGELASARFAFHRRRHRTLARLFLAAGAFAAAAVAARSLSERAERQQQQQQRKRSSAAGGGGAGGGEGEGSPPFPSSVDAASDALGTGDGASPLRGVGSKLSKRGGGGTAGTLDLSAEAASLSSAVSPEENITSL